MLISDFEEMDKRLNDILQAAFSGDAQEIARLVTVDTPVSYETNRALLHASENGMNEIVELLIPVSDPLENSSMALYKAAACGHVECVKLLIPHSDVNRVLESLSNNDESGDELITDALVEIDKKRLSEAIGLDEKMEQALVKKRKM